MGSRGNLKWNSSEVRELRQSLSLSIIQNNILIGLILGDGCLFKNIGDKNFRLQIEQSERHKRYVAWLYSEFKEWSLNPPKYVRQHCAWRFRTLAHPQITRFHEIFYKDRKKIIPPDIEGIFTSPLSLAVWFMDDGGVKSNKTNPTISTHCFSLKENEVLTKILKKNFGMKVSIHWDGKGNRLYIPRKEIKTFLDIVSPYILPSMKYKFPLTP
ncbi:hypothetical protein KJ562_00170 [Patescibacteria group bacterium]|nr:hypothetical protein [Patescibacteria group bacterium]